MELSRAASGFKKVERFLRSHTRIQTVLVNDNARSIIYPMVYYSEITRRGNVKETVWGVRLVTDESEG